MERFTQLASRIFPPRMYRHFGLFQLLMDYVRWWLSDNKYDSDTLEDVARDCFGTRERLFDAHETRAQSIKIGVMATTTSASQLRIFCNYNGEARASQHVGYAILRSNKATNEPYLWEVYVGFQIQSTTLLTIPELVAQRQHLGQSTSGCMVSTNSRQLLSSQETQGFRMATGWRHESE